MTRNFSCKTDHGSVCQEEVFFWRKQSRYGDVLTHMNYNGYGMIPTRHLWLKDEMGEISQLSGSERVYITVTKRNEKKRSWLVRPE